MAIYQESDWHYIFLNQDGTWTHSFLKADLESECFRDYGTYSVPSEFYG